MASAMPNIQVEFYANYYANWVDVSSYLMTEQGVSIRRGRGTRFDTSGVGTCSFVLDNFGGDFTPESTGGVFYGYGGWAEKNQPVRVTIDSVQVFEGYVDNWSASVSSDGQCLTSVSASDAMKFLGTNPLGSYGVERALIQVDQAGGVVYPLASNIGADDTASYNAWRNTSAADGTLYTTAGTGVHAWESESPPFCSGSMKLTPNASTLSGKAFKVPQTWNPADGGAAFGWFKTEQGASAFGNWIYTMWRTSGGTGSVSCYIDSSGQFVATITADGGTSVSVNSSSLSKDFNDDTWHFWLINVASGGKILSLYLDGAFITSATAANVLTIASTNRINIFGAYKNGTYALKGFQSTVGNATSSLAGTIAGITAIALDMWNAGRWGDGGNTISARCTKVLEFLYPTGTPTITVSNVSAMNVAGQETNNKAALAVLNEIADAERGVVYVDRLGDYKFRGSSARSAAYSLTIDALADLDGSNEFTLIADDSTFANRIVASGPAGSYTAEDATSVGFLGVVSETWSCVAWSLSTQVNARLADRLSTKARIGQVTVDLMTATSVSKSSVVQLVPLDCIRLTNLPSQLGATTRDAIVEGYTLSASVSSYQVTLDLSPTG